MPTFQGVFGKIFYVKRGNGLPVILIPGMGASHQEWFQQFSDLAKELQVISLDNAGSGKSVHPDCEISIEQMAEDVHRLMQHLKLEKVVLVGSSMGGLIAQHCLEKWPEKISGLILSATFGHVDQHIMQILGPLLRSRQSTKGFFIQFCERCRHYYRLFLDEVFDMVRIFIQPQVSLLFSAGL